MVELEPLLSTDLPLPGKRQGKVRDLYDCRTTAGRDALLIVATDRISAFDVVMPNGVPGKGVVLTQLSVFWFDLIRKHFADALEHHLISTDPADIDPITADQAAMLQGRVMIGRKTNVVPIECVARGYLAGSGWAEYQQTGRVCAVELPAGLSQCQKLPEPIFTPSTKQDQGHDQNISFEHASDLVGGRLMSRLRDLTLAIYRMAHDYAATRGIILADTKFEFGIPLVTADDTPILIDEALTPDSSRFWPARQYETGRDQASFDKQFVRNYLQRIVDQGRWDKQPPAPELPQDIIHNTLQRYLEAYKNLTGLDLKL